MIVRILCLAKMVSGQEGTEKKKPNRSPFDAHVFCQRKEFPDMSGISPEGEGLRRAIKWISNNMEEKKDTPLQKLIQEAVMRFDLSPRDADFLMKFYKDSQKGTTQ